MPGADGPIMIPQPRRWPDAGSLADQSAYVVAAFLVMDKAERDMNPKGQ